jgi:hypothetical protein
VFFVIIVLGRSLSGCPSAFEKGHMKNRGLVQLLTPDFGKSCVQFDGGRLTVSGIGPTGKYMQAATIYQRIACDREN